MYRNQTSQSLLGTSYLPVWSIIPPSLHHRSCLLMNSMTWDSTWLLLIGYMLISSYGLVYLLISQDRSYIVVLLTLCLLLDLGRLYLDLPQRSEYCLFMCLVWDDWIWYCQKFTPNMTHYLRQCDLQTTISLTSPTDNTFLGLQEIGHIMSIHKKCDQYQIQSSHTDCL